MFTKARFVALLAICFVSAQFLSTAHNAAFGDQDHLHDGHPCIVASIVKKSADTDVSDAPVVLTAEGEEWIEPATPDTVLTTNNLRIQCIRAPPLHT